MKPCSIEKIVRTLKDLREKHQDNLGAGELSELNAVIAELEHAGASTKSVVPLLDVGERALKIIALILEIVFNIGG